MNPSAALAWEISEIESMLAALPADNWLERGGFESRLERLRAELQVAARAPAPPKRISVTFKGATVDRSRSILADFGGKAIGLFGEAIDTIAACSQTPIGDRGRLPGGTPNGLRIVGPAYGSFGFELEVPARPEAQPDTQGSLFALAESAQALAEPSDPIAAALDHTVELLSLAKGTSLDDDGWLDRLVESQPRAVKKLFEFVNFVASRQSGFTIRRAGDETSVEVGEGECKHVAGLLNVSEIAEAHESVTGRLYILPGERRFELIEREPAISGKLAPDYSHSQELIGKSVVAELLVTSLRSSRCRYTLVGAKLSGE